MTPAQPLSSSPQTAGEWRLRVWALAWPIILSNSTQPLVGAVDTAVVGQLAEPAYIGGVSFGAMVFSLLFWSFGFLRMGTTGFVAQASGRADPGELTAILARAALLAGGLSALILLVQVPVLEVALWALEGSARVESLAAEYYAWRIWGAPAVLFNYVVLGFLIGSQRTGLALVVQLTLNGCNIVLDVVLVLGLELGIAGVAGASVVSEYVAALIGLHLCMRVLGQHGALTPPRGVWNRTRLLAMVQVNANIFIRTLCLILSSLYFVSVSGQLGDVVLAANALLLHLQHLMAFGLDGFAHATEALAGAAHGRRDRRAFRSLVRHASECAGVVSLVYALIYGLLGAELIALMTASDEVRAAAGRYLPWLVALPLVSVASFMLDGIFIGTTRSREMRDAMLISVAIYVAAVWTLLPLLGNHGLWLAKTVLMVARAATLYRYFPAINRSLELPEPRG